LPTTFRAASLLAISWLLCSVGSLQAQAMLRGQVVHDSSNRPIAGVEVAIEGKKGGAVTDAEGRYVLGELRPGAAVVRFRAVGYQPVRMRVNLLKGDTAALNARLLPEGVKLAALEVTARPTGPRGGGVETFEERRKLGLGRFIDSTLLRRSENRRLADLLAAHGGVKVVIPPPCVGRNTTNCSVDRKARLAINARLQLLDHCFMAIVVDGAMLHRGGDMPWENALDLNSFSIDQLQAIEVYASAGEVPIEYGGASATCGAILLWTRGRDS
jgi:hypothetical protein